MNITNKNEGGVKFPLTYIMCLYPRLIRNKRFLGYTTKNPKKGNATTIPIDDYRKQFVAVGCGNCIECRKKRARDWQIRLCEELKVWKYKYFVTMTFSAEALKELCEEDTTLYENVNAVSSKSIRRFLERWRKKYKESVKHWFITELGHNGTERIHIHGIIFTNNSMTNEELANIWQYGYTFTGDYCNEKTINYVIKYVTKIDTDHKGYVADIFASAGIGKNYVNENTKQKHKFAGINTIQYYTTTNGTKLALPEYYRRKFWTQEQRNQLWTYTLDAERTFVRGIECKHINRADGYNNYIRLLEQQQKDNENLGFGTSAKEWNEKIYKVTFDMINNTNN